MSTPRITEHVTTEGKPVDAKCVHVDHIEDVFVIAVSSLQGVSAEQITAQLQGKWEVTFNEHQRRKVVCQG